MTTMTSPTRRLILAAGLALATAGPALAAQPPAAKLSADEQALVDKATAYIQTLGSAKGRFIQTDARGAQTQGQFYLQRPGKARFAYDGPGGLLVVSNGNNVNISDPGSRPSRAIRSAARPWSCCSPARCGWIAA
jgi:outer membrane lipoprotein-sorting protein